MARKREARISVTNGQTNAIKPESGIGTKRNKTSLENVVARDGLEAPTPAFSGPLKPT